MGVLVQRDHRVKAAVPLRHGKCPQIHVHVPALAIRGGLKVGIVAPKAALRADCYPVLAYRRSQKCFSSFWLTNSSSAEIVVLEISRRLGEAKLVGNVVVGVQ